MSSLHNLVMYNDIIAMFKSLLILLLDISGYMI